MFHDVLLNLRFTIRMLLKHIGFSALTVLTLAIAIGANTAIFSMVNAVLLRPLPYAQPDRLVMLWESNAASGMEQQKASGPNLIDWRAQNHVLEDIAYWASWNGSGGVNLVGGQSVEKVRTCFVSSTLFPVLRVAPILGRGFLPEEDRYQGGRAAVISYSLWQRRYAGNTDVIGQSLIADSYGRREYTIVGVMPQGFNFPDESELWLPVGWNGVHLEERRSAHWYEVVARLKPGVEIEQAESELSTLQSGILRDHRQEMIGSAVKVVPLLNQAVGRHLRQALWILWAIVACILLIGCTNVANLTLAHNATRQKEIAVRLAVGASRGRITRQLLAESLVLGLAGGGAGILLAVWVVRLLIAYGGDAIPRAREISVDSPALLFTLAISMASALLFGLIPAIQLSRANCSAALKDGARSVTAGLDAGRIRSVLIVSQISLSVMLLIGAGLMINSFIRLSNLNHGFRAEHLITAEVDFSVSGFTTWVEPSPTRPQTTLRDVMERIQGLPGVQSTSVASKLPTDIGSALTQTVLIDGVAPPTANESPTSDFQAVSPTYFGTMGIPLLHGRIFDESDEVGAPGVAIVNETFVRRYLSGKEPIGTRFIFGTRSTTTAPSGSSARSPWKQIVGVVRDVRNINLAADTMPVVYVPYCQWPMQSPTLIVRTSLQPPAAADMIRAQVHAANASLPVPTIRTMDAILANSIVQHRFQVILCTLFGVTALMLCVTGIYGTISYSVARRTHEFGVRMALGARPIQVLGLVVGHGGRLVICGLAIGLLLSLAVTRVISSQLFGVTPTDPLTFALASILLACVGLAGCFIPALRAMAVNPMVALKYE